MLLLAASGGSSMRETVVMTTVSLQDEGGRCHVLGFCLLTHFSTDIFDVLGHP